MSSIKKLYEIEDPRVHGPRDPDSAMVEVIAGGDDHFEEEYRVIASAERTASTFVNWEIQQILAIDPVSHKETPIPSKEWKKKFTDADMDYFEDHLKRHGDEIEGDADADY